MTDSEHMTDSVSPEAMLPRVSIVMPMFNSAGYLESTVASVIRQTFTAWELILFDDGSTDETATIARDLTARNPRIVTATGRHQGVGVARNDGLRHTNSASEYVVFLDSDDTWTPDALEVLTRSLDAHPESPAAHALARSTDIEGKPYPDDDLEESMRNRHVWRNGAFVDIPVSAPTPFTAMIIRNWVCTPGTSIIRRSALAKIGELDPATSPADDWDLNIRLSRLGDLVFVDHWVINWRRHPGSLANTSKRWRWASLEVRTRSARERSNTTEQRAAALAMLAIDCRKARTGVVAAVLERAPRRLAAELVFAVIGQARYLQSRFARR